MPVSDYGLVEFSKEANPPRALHEPTYAGIARRHIINDRRSYTNSISLGLENP